VKVVDVFHVALQRRLSDELHIVTNVAVREFILKSVDMLLLYAGRLAENNCEMGAQFLMIWSFIADFSSTIAVRPMSLQHLMEALQAGSYSAALVNLHIGLIRFIQSEAEIAFKCGSAQVQGFLDAPLPVSQYQV
jgi:hypothetical protein